MKMPTYEYECQACGHTLEELQSFSDKPLRKCPKCKKLKLRRLISAGAGVIFKGSGFYETDYRLTENTEKANKESGRGGTSKSAGSDKSYSSSPPCASCKAGDCPVREE